MIDPRRPLVPVTGVLFPRLFFELGTKTQTQAMKFDHSDFLEKLTLQPLSTVSFTGHRKIEPTRHINKYQFVQQAIEKTIRELYQQGYNTFMTGMAEGFDLIAGNAVLNLRHELENLKLVCVIPFQGQQTYFNPKWKKMYAEILASADEAVCLSERYSKDVYFMRNDYLVAHCSCMVCYYNGGQRSGTGYTVRRAEKAKHKIINLYVPY